MMRQGYDLIDVREEKEVVQGAIPTAKNVPLVRIKYRQKKRY